MGGRDNRVGIVAAVVLTMMMACGGDDGPVSTADADVASSPPDAADTRGDVGDADADADAGVDAEDARDGAELDGDADGDADAGPFDPWSVEPRPAPDLEDPPAPPPAGCLDVVNGDAEAGDTRSWTVAAGELLAKGRTNAFDGDYDRPYEGFYQLVMGSAETSVAYQDLAMGELGPIIEKGGAYATARAFVRTREGLDEAWIGLEARSSEGESLAGRDHGPYFDTAYTERQVALALPEATREIRVRLKGVRHEGTTNDAWFDAIRVCVHANEPRMLPGELLAPPYLMDVREDGVVVRFETRRDQRAAVAYGDDPDHLDREVVSDAAETRHALRLTGLAPGSRPFYRVRIGDQRMPRYRFRTAPTPESDARIEFVMFADNQDGPEIFGQVAAQMAALDPDFVLSGGDCVQNGRIEEYRDFLFGPIFGLANRAGLLIGPGNHETYSSGIFPSPAAKRLWDDMVSQPGDGHCFGWRWGPLFVVVLDTERDHKRPSDQYDCIEAALESEAAATATFRAALFHRPALVQHWDPVLGIDSELTFFAAGMDAPNVRAHLAPLFERTGVDLVFNGHNHLYQYVPAWPDTVAWVTSGGAGGVLESGTPESQVNDWSAYIDALIFHEYHFLHVAIDQGAMGVRAVAMDGTILHAFTLYAD